MTATSSKSPRGLTAFLRAEYPFFIGLTVAVLFLALGNSVLENVAHPYLLAAIFLVLLGAVLWSAISVVRHADCVAVKLGEPYGTLVLTLSAIAIEVAMISTAMVHGANNPSLARDAMFGVVMIVLGGLMGISLLLGGLRHSEQHYNLQGVNSYLNVIMALAVLGLVFPTFTTSTRGPTFSTSQQVFLGIVSIVLYGIFLLIQTVRHRKHFIDSKGSAAAEHHPQQIRSGRFHALMLILYLLTVVVLAEKFAIPLDNSIERLGMPQAFGGAIIAALVMAPEGIGAVGAALRNQLQRSVNILLGSVLATIGLTIPAVVTIGLITHRSITLGVEGANLPLLVLTLGVSVVTFTSGKTNILQGCVHLLLFAVFLLLIFAP